MTGPNEHLLADAMLFGYSRPLLNRIRDRRTQLDEFSVTDELPDVVEKGTAGDCIDNSTRAIFFLMNRFPDAFPTAVLLSTTASVRIPGRPRKIEFKSDSRYVLHGGALLQDKKGQWVFVSPANYKKDGTTRNLTEFYTASTLTGLLSILEEKEGGIWPPENEILGLLETINQRRRESHHQILRQHYNQPSMPDRDLIDLSLAERQALGLAEDESLIIPHIRGSLDQTETTVKTRFDWKEIGFPPWKRQW